MGKMPRQAVALRYDHRKNQAPCVLAKGSGYVADKIIQAAQQYDIPLVQDPIAGEMFSHVDLGKEIPPEFYQAVAEILAFVYRLNNEI